MSIDVKSLRRRNPRIAPDAGIAHFGFDTPCDPSTRIRRGAFLASINAKVAISAVGGPDTKLGEFAAQERARLVELMGRLKRVYDPRSPEEIAAAGGAPAALPDLTPSEIAQAEKTIADAESASLRIRKVVGLDVAVPQGRA
ncbi:MAG: hypothetical protein IBJ15_02085 [Alphaproteobacteria bacterium]|nr:hypothetical protein [Alphaproteobacteria bacterium]